VLVVNTCAFHRQGQAGVDRHDLEMAEHKKTGACRRLVVTGCMAERYRDELRAQIPEIDAILGTGEVP
jgi:ribosomal protein S12 methylthiotransferase